MGQPGDPYDPNQGYAAQPGYGGQPGYGPPAYGQPGYGQQYPPQYGQYPPAYPYPYGYPPVAGSQRPGNAMAAAVLGYVAAGLLIAAGIVLLILASKLDELDDLTGGSHVLVTGEVALDGVLNFIAAGLLIAGGVSFVSRNPTGRVLLTIGSVIVIGESLYWIFRTDGEPSAIFWSLVYAALGVIAVSLSWTRNVSTWLRPSA